LRYLIPVLGLVVGVVVQVGCHKTSSDNGAAPTVTNEAGAVLEVEGECRNHAPVHALPLCDGCTRERCCPAVLDCDRSTDCTDLRTCLAGCQRGDFPCSDGCRVKHEQGSVTLGEIDSCATTNCANACQITSDVDIQDSGAD
jgi:hypothetical protein